MDDPKKHFLSVLPDLPPWVGTRGLLQDERSTIRRHPTSDGFLVWNQNRSLGSIVGDPEAHALKELAAQVPEILAFDDNVERSRSFLLGFDVERAHVYSAPLELPPPPHHQCRELTPEDIAVLRSLPDDLRIQLSFAACVNAPIVAAFEGLTPVAVARNFEMREE